VFLQFPNSSQILIPLQRYHQSFVICLFGNVLNLSDRDKKAEVDALDDLSPMHPVAPQVHPTTLEHKKGAANVG